MREIVPDDFCPHVEIGVEMVGGFVFASEVPAVRVGMCQECLDRCCWVFDGPLEIADAEVV